MRYRSRVCSDSVGLLQFPIGCSWPIGVGHDAPSRQLANAVATRAKLLLANRARRAAAHALFDPFQAMDEEHRRLLQIIRDASSGGKSEPNDSVSLRAQVRAHAGCAYSTASFCRVV
eukprot:5594213-Pleurochrysis_carterae.AAC.1